MSDNYASIAHEMPKRSRSASRIILAAGALATSLIVTQQPLAAPISQPSSPERALWINLIQWVSVDQGAPEKSELEALLGRRLRAVSAEQDTTTYAATAPPLSVKLTIEGTGYRNPVGPWGRGIWVQFRWPPRVASDIAGCVRFAQALDDLSSLGWIEIPMSARFKTGRVFERAGARLSVDTRPALSSGTDCITDMRAQVSSSPSDVHHQ